MGSSLEVSSYKINPIMTKLQKDTSEFKCLVKTESSDLTKESEKYNNECYQLTLHDKQRIQPLKDLIESEGFNFKYFITMDYWFLMSDISRAIKDNTHRMKKLRTVFKSSIRTFMFNEKHLNPSKKNYGGFHHHDLIEGIPDKKWLDPTNAMQEFMINISPELVFKCMFKSIPGQNEQITVIEKVIRDLHKSCPNGEIGLKVKPIHNLEGLLSYCTKQNKNNIPYEYVIDSKNSSGMDDQFIKKYHAQIRQSTKRLHSGQTGAQH